MEDPSFLAEVVVSHFERQKLQTEIVNAMPLYPTESILWDENQVPQVHYTGDTLSSPFGRPVIAMFRVIICASHSVTWSDKLIAW